VFGPTGWFFLGALIVCFGALLCWLVRARHWALRITAGVLAFALSTLFGAALVNQSYAYYTTWGALFDDLNGSGAVGYQTAMGSAAGQSVVHEDHDLQNFLPQRTPPISAPPAPVSPLPAATTSTVVSIGHLDLAARPATGTGRVVRLELSGAKSGISRQGYVYLPPQYFQAAYANTRFPVLELLHGDPGDPSSWIYGLHVPEVMDHAIDTGAIGPMVVVMPATFTGKHGDDCVDAPHGDLDDTYLSTDVPADLVADFRVLPQGVHWGIGGLSDGGFCAANLALRHPGDYGAVASMDGFYSSQADLAVLGKIFGSDAAALSANDPTMLALEERAPLPRFWIMSGTGNSVDTLAATYFVQAITTREQVEDVIVPGGTHTPPAWREVLPSMLVWWWNTLSGGPVGVGTSEAGPSHAPTPGHDKGPGSQPATRALAFELSGAASALRW